MDEVRFDMTYEGSAGTHEGSGEPHEGSGVFDRCCKKVKNYFFLKRPKIMFSEEKNFSTFLTKPARAGTLKIFVKKVKNPKIIIFF